MPALDYITSGLLYEMNEPLLIEVNVVFLQANASLEFVSNIVIT